MIKNDIKIFRNKIAKLEKQQGGGGVSSISINVSSSNDVLSGNTFYVSGSRIELSSSATNNTLFVTASNILEKVEGADPNTLLLLHMSGTSGSTGPFIDSSFDYNTISSFYAVSVPAVQITSDQSKFGGTSAIFNGSNYLQIVDVNEIANFDLGTSDFTIEAFVRLNVMPSSDSWPAGYANTMMLFTKGSTSAADGYGFVIGQTQLIFEVADTVIINGTHGMSINTWYHIAVCRNGTSVKLFVDGSEIASQTVSPISNLIGGASVWIGTETNQGAYFNGYLDELRVSNVARYTSSFSVPTQQFSPDGTFPVNKTGKLAYNNYYLYVCTDGTNGIWKRSPLQDF